MGIIFFTNNFFTTKFLIKIFNYSIIPGDAYSAKKSEPPKCQLLQIQMLGLYYRLIKINWHECTDQYKNNNDDFSGPAVNTIMLHVEVPGSIPGNTNLETILSYTGLVLST